MVNDRLQGHLRERVQLSLAQSLNKDAGGWSRGFAREAEQLGVKRPAAYPGAGTLSHGREEGVCRFWHGSLLFFKDFCVFSFLFSLKRIACCLHTSGELEYPLLSFAAKHTLVWWHWIVQTGRGSGGEC